ncbi:uncharacterized protein LOC127858112 [Dreissena polymorpha]|uniref:Uncharacterized protein n=1 Tax=Dreissena polymorpha TaxID=45954 RepID=A0A9D4BJS6_DREPO|nr:uncharacterized protein LOC127858112 [Dreissena polymorpha]KAH3706246.1 hypothetical protein DPMN_065631 [Dreissena polymorpha]
MESKLAYVALSAGLISVCKACEDNAGDSKCWYTLWYIWFVLGLFLVVIIVLLVLYIKHRAKERNRVRRRRRSTRTVPVHIVPTGPPAYTEPSHKPPSYEESIQQTTRYSVDTHNSLNSTSAHDYNAPVSMPGVIPYHTDEFAYRPPPTSMRMHSILPGSTSPPLPPSYDVSMQTRGQGHPS